MLEKIGVIILALTNFLQMYNINVPEYDIPLSAEIQKFIYFECQEKDVEYELVLGMIQLESNFDASLIDENDNKTYDQGLMQLNSCRNEELKKQGYTDLLDPYQNIDAGITIIADLLHRYEDEHIALTCYNAGENGAKTRFFSKGIYTSPYSRRVIEYKNKYLGSE